MRIHKASTDGSCEKILYQFLRRSYSDFKKPFFLVTYVKTVIVDPFEVTELGGEGELVRCASVMGDESAIHEE